MEVTDEMKKWMSNMKLSSAMGNLNKTTYEKQIANMVGSGKIDERQADYMESYLSSLKQGRIMER